MSKGFVCPVCSFGDATSAPYDADAWYQEICPCCGTQFGYDDATRPHAVLRENWIAAGEKSGADDKAK